MGNSRHSEKTRLRGNNRAPGQSGDPRCPQYADLAPLWTATEYVPVLYSEAAIDNAADLRIILAPGQVP
jgi:acyl-homoserine lactone acylase PvdQ